MPRALEQMSYYAIRDADGNPKAMHCVVARAPEKAIPITEDEARAISAAYRGPRVSKPKAEPDGMAAIAVLNEAKDSIVAIVNEASADRDKAFESVLLRLQALEAIFDTLSERADTVLGGKT